MSIIEDTINAMPLEDLEDIITPAPDPDIIVLTANIIYQIIDRLRVGRTYWSIKMESKALHPQHKSLTIEQIRAVDIVRKARIAELTPEQLVEEVQKLVTP